MDLSARSFRSFRLFRWFRSSRLVSLFQVLVHADMLNITQAFVTPPVLKVKSKAFSSTRDCNEIKGEIFVFSCRSIRIQTIYSYVKHVSTFLIEFRLLGYDGKLQEGQLFVSLLP